MFHETVAVDRPHPAALQELADALQQRAVIRRGTGLTPGTSVYEITYLHDGREAGRSLARGDEIESWRDDLRRA